MKLRRANRITAAVLLVIWLPACAYRWRAQTDARSAILVEQPDQARIRLTDGTLIILRNPIVTEDSIVGIVQATQFGVVIPQGTRLAVALGEVTNLELREIDTGTVSNEAIAIGAVVGVVAVIAIVSLLAKCGGKDIFCGRLR